MLYMQPRATVALVGVATLNLALPPPPLNCSGINLDTLEKNSKQGRKSDHWLPIVTNLGG